MNMLGKTVMDRITGFEGMVTGYVTYLTGCNQCLVTPRVDKEGKRRDGEWFDEQRLEVTGSVTLVLDNRNTPGPDQAAPQY